MNRPILLIGKRRFSFQWSSLVSPANDTLRCIALVTATANDNPIFGGRA